MSEATTEPIPHPPQRLAGLDALRAIAVLLVFARHAPISLEGRSLILRIARRLQMFGWVGVDLFFVLSGFLIGGLLFREYRKRGRLDVKQFLIRRGWKIYPPFFVFLGATLLYRWWAHQSIPREQLLGETLFLQNYLGALWNHTWSLAVEEHFYLLLPFLLLLLCARNKNKPDPFHALPAIYCALALILLIARYINHIDRDQFTYITHLFPTHLRIDSLFCGVVCAYYYHFHQEWFQATVIRYRTALLVGSAACFLPAFVKPLEITPWLYTAGFTVLSWGAAMLVIVSVTAPAVRSRALSILPAIGFYSYSIYLWHMPVIKWFLPWLRGAVGPLPFLVEQIVYVVGAIALGVGMARVVEVPALKLRDRLFPARVEGAIGASVNGRE
jgi:peptidoglycan/LPS O-acetylase OafA/YrhL